jgi:hypothetical protein
MNKTAQGESLDLDGLGNILFLFESLLTTPCTFVLRRFPACKCPPQYTGAHCELLKAVGQNSGTQLKTEKESAASLFAAFIVCILLVVLVLFFHVRRRRQQSSQDKTAIIRAAQAEQEESEAAMMEEVDFEGVMEDVELL